MQNFPADIQNKVLTITYEFLLELEAERPRRIITLEASLEKDLGIGSLERVEFFHRIEKIFSIKFSDAAMLKIRTLQDLAQEISKTAQTPSHLTPTNKKFKDYFVAAPRFNSAMAETLVDVLKKFAQTEADRPHIYLLDENGNEKVITYGQLFAAATVIAQGLCGLGLKKGETVAIMLPTCDGFFYSFFGILLAGGIPVPIYPPFQADQIVDYAKREAKILSNAQVRILISFQQGEALGKLLRAFIPSLKEVTTVAALQKITGEVPALQIAADDPALIQYTSGSTSDPKGVLLSHFNLLSNLRAAGEAINISATDRIISWLPLYHDMGLIGTWLGSLYFGVPVTIMSPIFFLNRPERWLWAIHYYRGTISAGPNFAYELCIKKISADSIEGLDLSSWRLAFNGAEAIYVKTLTEFNKKFAPYGLKPEVLFPVYGLAESSVALAFPPLARVPRIDRVQRDFFEKEQRAVVAQPHEKNVLEFISCGKPLPGHAIRVVDEADQELAERWVGSLQFKGPSSMQGYYRNPEATQAAYHQGWWSTGDLGYFANGEIFITGRIKDVIIKAGRNLYAAELEEITNQVPGVRKGCAVAFGIGSSQSGTENLVIVAETVERQPDKLDQIKVAIVKKIIEEISVPPDQVILVPPKTIPKTSSGKLRRAACKESYLQGSLGQKKSPVWLQYSKLFITSFWLKFKRGLGKLIRYFYTGYAALVASVIIFLLWLGVLILPRARAASWCHFGARNILRLAGICVTVHGQENIIPDQPVVYVANHASYLDALVLTAVLPAGIVFIAKQELLRTPFLRSFLKKLGHVALDRADLSQGLVDMNIAEAALAQGRSIAIFPEGTFTYADGLLPFKLGAFKLAVETKCAIVPVAIKGTRNILRDDNWLLKWGTIAINISPAIRAKDQDWSEIIRLRAAARYQIAQYCGEPAMDLIVAAPNAN